MEINIKFAKKDFKFRREIAEFVRRACKMWNWKTNS